MRYAQAAQGVEHFLGELDALIQVDRTVRDKGSHLITWRGRQSGIETNAYYPLEFQYLLDQQQYSVRLIDESFFQIFYKFSEDDRLVAARLAYYPAPMPLHVTAEDLVDSAEAALDRGDEELFNNLYSLSELMSLKSLHPANTSHVRFDYDSTCVSHEPAHLQFGGINDLRLPANFVPLPLAFLELVLPLIDAKHEMGVAGLGHARNNHLPLAQCSKIILLSHGSS
jgi:hypothetical protein